jgi:nitroimidazol reductase NimA-like FMN-containing flavoprotein (pyridoxamine 5'-phosphate oxidase superfamily)
MFGNLNAAEIENLLRQEITGRIGCHADDVTYVVPISYSMMAPIYMTRTFEGMKLNMMRKNPSVCFQVDHMQNMANWQSVIAWGKFEELTEKQLRNNALKTLNRSPRSLDCQPNRSAYR